MVAPPPNAPVIEVAQAHAAGNTMRVPAALGAEVVVEPQAAAGTAMQVRAAELNALPAILEKPGIAAMRECVTLYI